MTAEFIDAAAEEETRQAPSPFDLSLKMRDRCAGLAFLVECAAERDNWFEQCAGAGIARLIADIAEDAAELSEAIRRKNLIASGNVFDPIFSAIEHHKTLHRRFEDLCRRTDEVAAEQEGRVVKAEDRVEWKFADRNEQDALQALIETKPETAAGVKAAVEYISQVERGGESGLLVKFAMTLVNCELLETKQ